ncbi:hypothetical protein [Caldicoprobacter algeriensis]|nr:hypothetical protein [Caldicoprobacter algeriensis]
MIRVAPMVVGAALFDIILNKIEDLMIPYRISILTNVRAKGYDYTATPP